VSAGPSLYRRHRPRTFADVVGQEHVVRTLRNAVEQDKVHHAYLFVGTRGTGKTSMAKILAACLNCEHGPTVEPCGTCESCVAIANATSLDVIEMDAASNNSVDDIRDLRESVAYAPVSGRHKVYILDEAHMLSSQAWNAFLKTLEEPPPHTIFVLATTEAQKVLPTVVDRCHRFDFGRPTVEDLGTVITRVAGQEGIEIAPDAVALLARHATGSFRDALGTLEQLVTYSGRQVATEDVLAVLGVADADLLFAALEAVGAHDARGALQAAASLASSGRDLGQVMRDLEAHTRELLIVQTLGEVPAELHITPDRDARLAEQAQRVGRADLVRFLELLADAMKAVKDGAEARTRIELALVEAASPQVDPSARALMARLEALEAALARGGGAPAQAAAPVPPAPAATSGGPSAEAPSTPAAPAPAPAPAVSPKPAAPAALAPSGGGRPTADGREDDADGRDGAARPEAAVAVADPPPAPPPPVSVPAPEDIDGMAALWPAVRDAVCAENQMVGIAISDARPVELRDDELVVAFAQEDRFNQRQAALPEHKAIVEGAIRGLAGRRLRVSFELRDLAPEAAEEAAQPPSEDEIVARFVTEFDAEEIVPDPDDDKEGQA
jgi:DNA polymerase III subunit gamma/tau